MDAWKGEFRGNAAETLLDTISVYLAQGGVYSYHANILNSSGTGKSRLVDELSKSVITVPMCLRPEGSHGLIHKCSLLVHPSSPCLQGIRLPIKCYGTGCFPLIS